MPAEDEKKTTTFISNWIRGDSHMFPTVESVSEEQTAAAIQQKHAEKPEKGSESET